MGMSVISLPEGPGAEVLSDTKTLVQLVDNLPRVKEIMEEIGTAHNKAAAVITEARAAQRRLAKTAKKAAERDELLEEREKAIAARENEAAETKTTYENRAAALKEKEKTAETREKDATKVMNKYEKMVADLRQAVAVEVNGG